MRLVAYPVALLSGAHTTGMDCVHVQLPSQRALQPSDALPLPLSSIGTACVSEALDVLQADQEWAPTMTLSSWRETSSRPREPD